MTTIVYPLTRSRPGGGPDWSGTHLLALGLDASLRDSGPWVEIEQPNDRTLVIKTPVWSNEAERHLFTRAENGDLVMEVQQTRTGVDKFVIPHGDANSFYMRWTTYRPFDAVPAGAR